MRPSPFLSAVLGLAFFAAAGYALYLLARFGAGLFDAIAPDVTAVTAAGALTLLLCAYMIANSLHALGRREEMREMRAARAAVYEQVLRMRGEAPLRSGPLAGERRFLAAEALLTDPQMLLHASTAVLNAYLRLRRAEEGAAQTGATGQQEMAHLVRAMRRDLGQRAPDLAMPELTEMLAPPARERVS